MIDADIVKEAMQRGMARAGATDWAGAVEAFRRAVSFDPTGSECRYRLGWALWKRSEADKPTMADLAFGYGAQVLGFDSVARDRGRKFARHKRLLQDAAHWLREAVARDPGHADAHFYLAQTLKALGYKQEAIDIARKASEIQPNNRQYATLVANYAEEPAAGAFEHRAKEGSRLTWSDLVLSARTKRELRQMQLMLENPTHARELGVDPPTGILLKGAPGTGKTTIARVLANEAKCKFYSVSPADINQMYVGVSEQRVKELFARARANAPAIIFIDEIDALLPARQGGVAIHSDKVVNQFLQEMDGMTPNSRVFIVGASNRPDMLDPAVRRGGRLSREIEIPLPDREERLELLELFARNVKVAEDVDLGTIASETDGWSGAGLKALVNEAGLQALIRIADSPEPTDSKTLTAADFREALTNIDTDDDD